jgi:hypothetical protein
MNAKATIQHAAQGTFQSILTWQWTKQLLYWLIISAGTMSECTFLVASLWMSVNSSVHPFVMLFITDATASHISELATTAYVALPELILGMACVTVISHIRIWLYEKSVSAAIWTVLYGLPTLVFLVLSLITLGCSVTSTHFIMPEPLVVTRAIAAFMFAFTSLLHAQLGVPQERDRLQKKDDSIAALQAEMETAVAELRTELITTIANLRAEKDAIIAKLQQDNQSLAATIESQSAEIAQEKSVKARLQTAMDKNEDAALGAYSDECIAWLKSGAKTVSIDEITRFTGHSKRKITSAIDKGMLQTASRNKELILVASLVMWLKTVQPSSNKAESEPLLHIVNG